MEKFYCQTAKKELETCIALDNASVIEINSGFITKHGPSAYAIPAFVSGCKGCFVKKNYDKLEEKIKNYESKPNLKKVSSEEEKKGILKEIGINE